MALVGGVNAKHLAEAWRVDYFEANDLVTLSSIVKRLYITRETKMVIVWPEVIIV